MEIYLVSFLSLALAHFVALLSPGVDFFLILSNSSKYGRIAGVITSSGIAFANLVYILLALFGITLIKDNQFVFTSIKILGSLYLLYIAVFLLKSSKREPSSQGDFGNSYLNLNNHNIPKLELRNKSKKDMFKYFSMGFLSAILNPKNSIFYFTMFSISLQDNIPFYIQSFYAIWMFLAVLFWDIFVVYLVTNSKSRIFLENYSYHIEKISGLVLLFLSISIIFNTF